ncbi:MAG: integrase core domain-containing protein, partial [Actinomycetota bacterium]
LPSMHDRARPWLGRHQAKLSTSYYYPLKVLALRRPLEPGQYTAIVYTDRLVDEGIAPSVGSVGDSYDNAMAESVIGLYKAELIHRRGPWRRFEDVEIATLEWIDWWNRRRIHSSIGDVPPAEFEAAYAATITDKDPTPVS